MAHSYFKELARGDEPEHPVDIALERRLPQTRLVRRIRSLGSRLLTSLGERRSLWLTLESLLGEYHANRGETYFDLGYEHGAAAARAEAKGRGVLSKAGRALAAQLRNLVVQSELPARERLLVLLDTAWALARDEEHRS